MKVSRRDLGFLVPALVAVASARPAGVSAQVPVGTTLGSRNFRHDDIAYAGDDQKKGRRFFMGETHGGFTIETHETILGTGVQTHAPHRHRHEEIIIVVEGAVETWVEGTTETVEAGSVIVYGSNQLHSARNAGDVPCRYYVVELRGDE